MPVHCPITISRLTREQFLERDEIVMRCAYATQNRLGRLCDERVYENHLAARLRAEGMPNVRTQIPITVTHGAFSKKYRLDLVADNSVYELKTVVQLVGEHDAQVFNYAMLLDVLCIKLLNFRNPRVEGKLRFSAIDSESRHNWSLDTVEWQALCGGCEQLKGQMKEVLHDFGAFLDTSLYVEALAALCGAYETRLQVACDGLVLGTHPVHLIADEVAFCVTAFTTSLVQQRTHVIRLLECLPLRGLHWINLNHAHVSMVTLVNGRWGSGMKDCAALGQ